MTTVKEVLKLKTGKNRAERARVAQLYPNLITSSQEEILEAALGILSADQLEYALSHNTDTPASMSSELEQELIRSLEEHDSFPSGRVPSEIKTLEIDEETNELRTKPGRPSKKHKEILAKRLEASVDPQEDQEAFALVKTYPLAISTDHQPEDDDDDDFA